MAIICVLFFLPEFPLPKYSSLRPQHAHVSRGEVIGLLGGTFNEAEKVLKVGKKQSAA